MHSYGCRVFNRKLTLINDDIFVKVSLKIDLLCIENREYKTTKVAFINLLKLT